MIGKKKRDAGRAGSTASGENGTDDGSGKKRRLDLSSLEELKRNSEDIANARNAVGLVNLCNQGSCHFLRTLEQWDASVLPSALTQEPKSLTLGSRVADLKAKEVRNTPVQVR